MGPGILGVVPDIHLAILFLGMPGAQAGALWYFLAVGYFLAFALGAEAPAVEGTANRLAHHPTTVAQVGAQVRAERILQHRRAAAGAVQHQLPVKCRHRFDFAHVQFMAAGNGEPPHRELRRNIGPGFTRVDD